jgi:hypothetical protein
VFVNHRLWFCIKNEKDGACVGSQNRPTWKEQTIPDNTGPNLETPDNTREAMWKQDKQANTAIQTHVHPPHWLFSQLFRYFAFKVSCLK